MEKSGLHFYIHMIYTDDVLNTFYARICTNRDDAGFYDLYKVRLYENGQMNKAHAAVFAGDSSKTLSSFAIGFRYQSYTVGQMIQYTSN